MTALSTPGAAEEAPLYVTFWPEFILARFREFQRGGCRDQTFIDNGPHFVESLLALASRSPSPVGDALTLPLDFKCGLWALVQNHDDGNAEMLAENIVWLRHWLARAALSPRPEEPEANG